MIKKEEEKGKELYLFFIYEKSFHTLRKYLGTSIASGEKFCHRHRDTVSNTESIRTRAYAHTELSHRAAFPHLQIWKQREQPNPQQEVSLIP